MSITTLKRHSFKWHLLLSWVAAIALISFSISAITHPLLAWTGPQSSAFMPPKAVMQASQVNAMTDILKRHQIQHAIVVKLLPSQIGVVLQVTEHNDQPRRYFDLSTRQELTNYDAQHAQWLARYYALNGDLSTAVKHVEFQTEFDHAYPWVNRLLPVYKVTFDTDDNLSTYVYTEINALAGLTNHYKTRMQSVFRTLHTWSWLERFESARIVLMAGLLLCLILMTITGVAMIFLFKKRKAMTRRARTHRMVAYALWLPLLGFSLSGFWHLLHYGFTDSKRGLQLGSPIELTQLEQANALPALPTFALNQISLIQHDGELFYRLSLPAKRSKQAQQHQHDHHSAQSERKERFAGKATEQGGLYYSVKSGQLTALNDKQVAIRIATQKLQLSASEVSNTQLIKRFGLHYDFRNKRLPVWQIDFNSESGDKVFIDPATGTLVDRLVNQDRYEGYSFSFLHKWNFLTPFVGRQWRDVVMVIVLLSTLLLTLLGISMRLAISKRRR